MSGVVVSARVGEGSVDADSAVELDGMVFRRVMGSYPTGVVVIAGVDESGAPIGMVVGTFSSVSLDPPLVSFMPAKTSSSWAKLSTVSELCVNVLAADQEDLCRRFASKNVEDKFEGVEWTPSPGGAPRILGAVSWIDCTVTDIVEAGDHYVVFARVSEMIEARSVSPLTFIRGGYGRFSADSLVAADQPGLMSQLRTTQHARTSMEHLARETGYEVVAQAAVDEDLVLLAVAGGDDPDWAAHNHVGMRLPFIPPFGGIFMAWSTTDSIKDWVARRYTSTPEQLEEQTAALSEVRGAGFVIVRSIDSEVDAQIDRLFAGETPTPEEISALRKNVHLLSPFYTTSVPTEPTSVRHIGAPVFDKHGNVTLVIWLIVNEELTPSQTEGLLAQLTATTTQLTQATGGKLPESA